MRITNLLRILALVLTLLILLGTAVFLAVRWRSIPEEVPAHFDGAGRIDGYQSKGGLLVLHGMSWLMAIMLAISARVPSLWNRSFGPIRFRISAVRVGDRISVSATGLILDLTALVLTMIFSYMTVSSALCRDLGGWFLPASLALVLLPLLPLLIGALCK